MATYTVKSGDTLSGIAKKSGISLSQLYTLNPKFKTDPKYKGGNLIWPGTTVKVPSPPAPPSTTRSPAPPSPPANSSSSSGSASSSSTAKSPSPPKAQAPTSPSPSTSSSSKPVKSAPIETVIFQDETFAEQFIVDVLFEDVVGQELLSIARNDTVNGQEVIYQPLKNLDLLQTAYNPSNILNLSETSVTYFENFIIKLNDKIPTVKNGLNGKNYYVDQTNGDIVIELKDLEDDEQVEIQIATSGTIEGLGI